MSSAEVNSAMAVLGGTFDPIHNGHLQLATQLTEILVLEQILLMPSYQPTHKDYPTATVEQRLAMLELAVTSSENISVDSREIEREGPSYTLLSLQEIRTEIGPNKPLYFVLGEDAFSQLDSWYQWQELLNYTHLVVAVRPSNHPKLSNDLTDFVEKNKFSGSGYPKSANGAIVWMDNPVLEISSSDIRQRINEGRTIQYLVPTSVLEYIEQQKIYN